MRRQTITDVELDARIWENKQHLTKPLLVKGEAAIAQFRKWHRQFYDSSPEPRDEPMQEP